MFKKKKRPRDKREVHVMIVLDTSSSMGVVRDKTIRAYNEYINGLKADKKVNYRVSLTQFNNNSWIKYNDLRPEAVPQMTKYDFVPSGCTALLDAVYDTVTFAQLRDVGEDSRFLCVIITDGEENMSQRATNEQIKKLIAETQAGGRWTYLYLGSHPETWASAGGLGISVGNTIHFNAGDESYATSRLLRGTSVYASMKSSRTDTFFDGTE